MGNDFRALQGAARISAPDIVLGNLRRARFALRVHNRRRCSDHTVSVFAARIRYLLDLHGCQDLQIGCRRGRPIRDAHDETVPQICAVCRPL